MKDCIVKPPGSGLQGVDEHSEHRITSPDSVQATKRHSWHVNTTVHDDLKRNDLG